MTKVGDHRLVDSEKTYGNSKCQSYLILILELNSDLFIQTGWLKGAKFALQKAPLVGK